jgi:pyridine nucleotide-disulfide oxidoreductase
MKRIVIVGAGFAGLAAAKAVRHSDAEVFVVDRANHNLFQPLLYQVPTTVLSPAQIASPIRGLLKNQRNTPRVTPEFVARTQRLHSREYSIRSASGSNLFRPPRDNLEPQVIETISLESARSSGLCRDKAEARRRNHLSYTMIPPATGCSPLYYWEAPKRIGLTMVSILAAISSAGTRFGD